MKISQLVASLKWFLILSLLLPQPLFSQSPRARNKAPRKPDVSAEVITELLTMTPLEPEEPQPVAAPEAPATTNDNDDEEIQPPADDAPLRDLIEYWSGNADEPFPASRKPSDRVRQRLLDAGENRPWLLPGLLNALPDTTEAHDRLYKLLTENSDEEDEWREPVKEWLQLHSSYFRAELLAELQSAGSDQMLWRKLEVLARLDWDTAKPLIERYVAAEMPLSLSWGMHYRHAVDSGDSAEADRWRTRLKEVVTSPQGDWITRSEALNFLLHSEWSGQQEWVLSLFSDPSLSGQKVEQADKISPVKKEKSNAEAEDDFEDREPPILSLLLDQADKWLPVVRQLVGHENITIHNAAVACLLLPEANQGLNKKQRREVAQTLLPWLSNPAWAKATGRSKFIQSLAELKLPESVPGLIWVLDYDEDAYARAQAAEALTEYRDPRAVPALRRALLRETSEASRTSIITALALCGGLPDEEQAAAFEAYARKVVTEKGAEEIERAKNGEADKPLPLEISIGRVLFESDTIPATEGMAEKLFDRVKALRKTEPAVAQKILDGIEFVSLRVAELNLLERLREGYVDAYAVTLLLDNRDSLRKNFSTEIYALLKQGGHATGVAAMLLDDDSRQADILKSADAKAQRALLACARYLRDKLPLELVGALFDSRDKLLAAAAESYLLIEDSTAARRLILARHPGEAFITGDLSTIGEHLLPLINKLEDKLRREVKQPGGADELYLLVQSWQQPSEKKIVIRVRGEQAELSVDDEEGRRNIRWLTANELQELRDFTSSPEVEGLGAERLERIPGATGDFEFLKLTKAGGRRVMLKGTQRTPNKDATLHEQLSGLLTRLSRTGDFKIRYDIEDVLPGVEILFADKRQKAEMVCLEGRELRVLVSEKTSKQIQVRAEDLPDWYVLAQGQLVQKIAEPSACHVLDVATFLATRRNFAGGHGFPYSGTRAGDTAYLPAFIGEDAGIWKLKPGRSPEKILSGMYRNPVVTADEKWLVAMKEKKSEGREFELQLVRINLQTGQEFIVTLPAGKNPDDWIRPVTFVVAHKKILLGSLGYYGKMKEQQLMLDPETGTTQLVSGDFRPLYEEFSFIRPLQPAEKPGQFWAALSDGNRKATQVGRYDTATFAFKPVLDLPGLQMTSLHIYVDATERKLYLTYRGHLLRLPLPAEK